jgi:hypothetical protein
MVRRRLAKKTILLLVRSVLAWNHRHVTDVPADATVPSVSPRRLRNRRQVLLAVAMVVVAAAIVGGGLWLGQMRHDAVERDIAWCTYNASSDEIRGPETGRLCVTLIAG